MHRSRNTSCKRSGLKFIFYYPNFIFYCVCAHVWMYAHVSVCVCLCICVNVSVCLMYICVSVFVCVGLHVCLSVYVFMSWALRTLSGLNWYHQAWKKSPVLLALIMVFMVTSPHINSDLTFPTSAQGTLIKLEQVCDQSQHLTQHFPSTICVCQQSTAKALCR